MSNSQQKIPPVNCYFSVFYFHFGVIPSPKLDMTFRQVSGIARKVQTTDIRAGGENVAMTHLPERITHDNLILERGLVEGIGLNLHTEFNIAMSWFTFFPGNALVVLQDGYNKNQPLASWLFRNTYPVSWKISDFSYDDHNVVIETLELTYTHFYSLVI